MRDPLDAEATSVPSVGRGQLILVDGRTFAISDDAGQMLAGTHGLVHDDLRHLSRLEMTVVDADVEILATDAPTPLSAVVVGRLVRASDPPVRALLIRRRWIADGLREDVRIHNTSAVDQTWTLRMQMAADFAHVFDVKAGLGGEPQIVGEERGGWRIDGEADAASTRIRVDPSPDRFERSTGAFEWDVRVAARQDVTIALTAEPVVDDLGAGLAFPIGLAPADAIPMRRVRSWQDAVPRVVSTDPRLMPVVEQALSDIAALRIVDAGHPERTAVAAGAPWFMTLFGRDSLLTSWMTLPFDPGLTSGVLAALAELQGSTVDPVAEEQPGKIMHELRRRGGGGPFASRRRYYGTVDATPLFVMVAAEAHRWGALSDASLSDLAPAVDRAVEWIVRDGDSDGDGFIDYQRNDPSGLSNQGWKDSWDGVTFADGEMPAGPIALAEVQGYAYAAYLGAAELSAHMPMSRSADELVERADALRRRFNQSFWDDRGWFAMGVDGTGRRIDSLTTNPGHALWTGIADDDLAHAQLDRYREPAMWTGWGLRTLAETMTAYDPLSYHNGSVWPHDTALCAAGAARYGRWDVVDQIVDGALDAATAFGGRPPELFAGIARDEVPMPVVYPSSCSPQAWSSASILLLIRAAVGLAPGADRASVVIGRRDLASLADLRVDGLCVGGREFSLVVADGAGRIEM